ncbi:unnamed protein product, partial [Scytosiphon promiscuus]
MRNFVFKFPPLWTGPAPVIDGDLVMGGGAGGAAPPDSGQGEADQRGVASEERREDESQESRQESRPLLGPEDVKGLSLGLAQGMADVLRQGIGQQSGPAHPSGTSRVEVRQRVEIEKWTGEVGKGESLQNKFRVFESSFRAYLSSENLSEVLEYEDIHVGLPDIDLDMLKSSKGTERVEKSLRVWHTLISKTGGVVQNMILSTGSPQQGWRTFVSQHRENFDREGERLDREWNELKQGDNEDVLDYLRRGLTIQMSMNSRLGPSGHGRKSEGVVCRHIARRLNPSFDGARDFLLFGHDLSRKNLEFTLTQAKHERRQSGREGDGSEETRHALYTSGMGRGGTSHGRGQDDGGPRTAGWSGGGARAAGWSGGGARAAGRSGGDRNPNQQAPMYCKRHGENETHNTEDCVALRREFEEFLAFREQTGDQGFAYEGRRTGRDIDGFVRRPDFVQGRPREQPFPQRSDGNWGRGLPPRQAPGRGRGPASYTGRHPGGRGLADGRPSSSGGRGAGRGGNFRPNFPPRSASANGPPRYANYAGPSDGYGYDAYEGDRWGTSDWQYAEEQQHYPETYGYGLAAQEGDFREGYGAETGGYGPGYFSAGGEVFPPEPAGHGDGTYGAYAGYSPAGPDAFQPMRYQEAYGAP